MAGSIFGIQSDLQKGNSDKNCSHYENEIKTEIDSTDSSQMETEYIDVNCISQTEFKIETDEKLKCENGVDDSTGNLSTDGNNCIRMAESTNIETNGLSQRHKKFLERMVHVSNQIDDNKVVIFKPVMSGSIHKGNSGTKSSHIENKIITEIDSTDSSITGTDYIDVNGILPTEGNGLSQRHQKILKRMVHGSNLIDTNKKKSSTVPAYTLEERYSQQISRMTRKKIYAQLSRQKKKAYINALELKVDTLEKENGDYKKLITRLQKRNFFLLQELTSLQTKVGIDESRRK